MPAPSPRRLMIIRNPVASGGRRQRFLRDTMRALHGLGAPVALAETEGPGHAVRLAAEVDTSRFDAVVVAGGDGTINEAVNGLAYAGLASPPPIGILPIGTANVLALELGLMGSAQSVAAALAYGPLRPMYAARVQALEGDAERLFVSMAGIGFDARVVAAVSPRLKQRFGVGAYYIAAVKQGLRDPFPRYRVSHAGNVEDVSSALFANGRLYGGKFVNVQTAGIDNPHLYARLFPRGGRWATLRAGLALVADRFETASGSYVRQGEVFDVEGPVGEPMHGDGDVVARLPVRISANAAQLSVIGPLEEAR